MKHNRTRDFLFVALALPVILFASMSSDAAYGYAAQTVEISSLSDQDLVTAIGSNNDDRAHAAVIEIVNRGERIIPLLMKCKGNKKFYYGYGLGDRNSAFLLPLPTGNPKEDYARAITIEVAALYLISAIYYQSLEFAQAPYLTDGSRVKMQRFNTTSRVAKAWRAVEEWYPRVKSDGLAKLREQKRSPLGKSSVHFWATSD